MRQELLKLYKLKSIPIIYFLLIAYILVVFFQKTINPYSGFFEENLSSMYIVSFIILLFDSFSNILFILIGAYISGVEFKNDSWNINLTYTSRKEIFFRKIYTLVYITIIVVLSIVIIALCCAALKGNSNSNFDIVLLLKQISIMIIFSTIYGLIGFVLTLITTNVSNSTILGVLFINFSSIISNFIPEFDKISLTVAQSNILFNFFTNLHNDEQLTIQNLTTSNLNYSLTILFLYFLGLICLGYVILINKEFE